MPTLFAALGLLMTAAGLLTILLSSTVFGVNSALNLIGYGIITMALAAVISAINRLNATQKAAAAKDQSTQAEPEQIAIEPETTTPYVPPKTPPVIARPSNWVDEARAELARDRTQ
jgi:outer membrane biosynthesis protein TonB